MNDRKIKFSSIIFTGIIIINFFYTINIQPVVIGRSDCIKTNLELNYCNSNNKQLNFLKNNSCFWHNCNCKFEPKFLSDLKIGNNMKNLIILYFVNNENSVYYFKNIQVKSLN